jgi:hypothetical protein
MLEPDFRDMLRAFTDANVEFLVVGAYAMAGHGLPRATRDLDLWIRPTPQNADRALAALQAFGAPPNIATRQDLMNPNMVVQIGVEPLRVDIMMTVSGIEFDSAYAARIVAVIDDVTMPLLDRAHLLANKRASARTKDLLDVEWLESHPEP